MLVIIFAVKIILVSAVQRHNIMVDCRLIGDCLAQVDGYLNKNAHVLSQDGQSVSLIPIGNDLNHNNTTKKNAVLIKWPCYH